MPGVPLPVIQTPGTPSTPMPVPPANEPTLLSAPAHQNGSPAGRPLASGPPGGVVPVDPRTARLRAPIVLSALFALPDAIKPSGGWLTLVEVISRSPDRGQQLEAIHGYWKLSADLAEFRLAWDEHLLLEQARDATRALGRPRANDWVELQARLASAATRLEAAEADLLGSQNELSQRLRLAPGAPLPLPSDKPHVGTYVSRFEQIYASFAPPPGALFANRTFTLRYDLVEGKAMVVQAAQDLLDAQRESFGQGAESVETFVGAVDRLSRERRAFITAVRQYNDQIADYALSIPHPPQTAESLVGMLIKTPGVLVPNPGIQPVAMPSGVPSEVMPATFNQPLPAASNPPAVANAPPAAPPNFGQAPLQGEPTLAPPRPRGQHGHPPEKPSDSNPVLTAPSAPATASPATPAMNFGPRDANYPPAAQPGTLAGDPGTYSALIDAAPAKRAQELANLLNWTRQLPEEGTSLGLEECLGTLSDSERRAAIGAYWRTRESMARYQLLSHELDQMNAVSTAALAGHDRPRGAEAMLQVHYAQQSLKAAQAEAHLALVADQFALTQLTRRPLADHWVLAATSPHGGEYRLKADAQPQSISDSFAFRRATAVVPALHRCLEEQAEAVVLADASRAAYGAAFEAGQAPVEQLLAAFEREATATQSFLSSLTRYNTEIAGYALVVLPPQAPAPMLARALVTQGALAPAK